MALPPQQVRIKRKKDEEPVDSLFVETEQKHKRRRRTDFIFRRVQDEDNASKGSNNELLPSIPSDCNRSRRVLRAVSTQPRTGVPTVQTTLPGDELRDGINGVGRVNTQCGQNDESSSTQIDTQTSSKHDYASRNLSMADPSLLTPSSPFSNPRRFHLTRSTPQPLSQPSADLILHHGDGFRPNVALFVEKKPCLKKPESSLGFRVTAARHQENSPDNQNQECPTNPKPDIVTPQQRPNAGVTEKQWRTEQWSRDNHGVHKASTVSSVRTGTSIDTNSSLWDYTSLQLAEQLQEVAQQESANQSALSTPAKGEGLLKMKARPKLPEKRYAERHPEESTSSDIIDAMDLSSDAEDSEYVYDTYIREPGQPLIAGIDVCMENADFGHQSTGKVGLLVIKDEDQAEWEAFAEDDDSDKDWNSEEEDENAEDYYGNDYPDDEVESEDEFGKGAYNYRRGASDEEEYDSGDDHWSDDDRDLHHPWRTDIWSAGAKSMKASDGDDYEMI